MLDLINRDRRAQLLFSAFGLKREAALQLYGQRLDAHSYAEALQRGQARPNPDGFSTGAYGPPRGAKAALQAPAPFYSHRPALAQRLVADQGFQGLLLIRLFHEFSPTERDCLKTVGDFETRRVSG